MKKPTAEIGVFGGSGLYSFLENPEMIEIDTPYGQPSDKIAVGEAFGKKVAFLPRHGSRHSIPPHKINYRANLYAFKELGVRKVFAPGASGSLQAHIKLGEFVICDQFIDRTSGRLDTFYDGPLTTHISSAVPFCPNLRATAAAACEKLKIPHKPNGTLVVIQGPRFSTIAESRWFTHMGWEAICMTIYPEVVLARELEMCYVNIALITDYDTGLVSAEKVEPVLSSDVIKVFKQNSENIKKVLMEMIRNIDPKSGCSCHHSLEFAVITPSPEVAESREPE